LTPYLRTAFSLGLVGTFTISQLAQRAGVNVETVRYYERRGLLRQPPRTAAGYRQYAAVDLGRLQFILRAKSLGFTLGEVANLFGENDQMHTPDVIVDLARRKMRALQAQRHALERTHARLQRLIDICDDPSSEDCMALRVVR
jgi:MerR family transcriptional regulator, mercuric resistance operon regulatory protein